MRESSSATGTTGLVHRFGTAIRDYIVQMQRALAVAVLSVTGCARWSAHNTALELAFVTEQAIDYRQTSEAIAYGGEGNPIIGAHGENASPAAYFVTTTILHAFISAALPRYWRETFQGATLVDQGWNVYRNVATQDQNEANGCASSRTCSAR